MKLCIVTHKVAIGDGQGRVNYEVAWEAVLCCNDPESLSAIK